MENSIRFFLTVALIFLTSIYFIITFVSYEKEIEQLNIKIETLNEEIECTNVMLDFNNTYQEELEHQLDSLQNRYKLFDSDPAKDFIDIMNAIMQVESRGDADAYNPGEDAVGILQQNR